MIGYHQSFKMMKSYILLFTSVLLLVPLLSCADNSSNVTVKNKLLPSGDILTVSTLSNGKAVASYFSTKSADVAQLVKRIVNILNQTKADKTIINFIEARLPKHPYLKKSQFKMPLTNKDGKKYLFTYSSDFQSNLYILNYQYIGKTQ